MQDLAADRIEKRLRALGLAVCRQQADVVQLDLLPDFVVDIFGVVLVFEQFDAFVDPFVVRRNAFAREPLQRVPVAGFEQGLRANRGFAENPVMPVETFEHRLRDIEADLRREQFRKVIHIDRACFQCRRHL